MMIRVRVTPRAKQNLVKPGDPLRVYVTAVPEDGRANDAALKLLAGRFDVAKSRIRLVRGATSRDKVIEILDRESS
jgi:uncharacterized protein YggU (UPF0235/DUF167 family)